MIIDQLPSVGTPALTDETVTEQGQNLFKVTWQRLLALFKANTATSELTNDAGFVNATQAAAAAPVQSVNGQTGAVTYAAPVQSVNGQTGNVSAIPSGGNSGDVLVKSNATDYATGWQSVKSILPPPVELLPKTASRLSSSQSVGDRATLALSDDISNYRMIQVIMTTGDRDVNTMIVVPTYGGEDVVVSVFTDNNTSYYCSTMVKLSGTNLIVRRAFFSNFSSPSYQVIGIP